MFERENLVQEFWKRCSSAEGINFSARNPSVPPAVEDLPAVQFFEMSDRVMQLNARGASTKPFFNREMSIIAEVFIKASTETAATKELTEQVDKVKKAIYSDGVTLGKKNVFISEEGYSRPLRPNTSQYVIGIGITFKIQYVENVNNF